MFDSNERSFYLQSKVRLGPPDWWPARLSSASDAMSHACVCISADFPRLRAVRPGNRGGRERGGGEGGCSRAVDRRCRGWQQGVCGVANARRGRRTQNATVMRLETRTCCMLFNAGSLYCVWRLRRSVRRDTRHCLRMCSCRLSGGGPLRGRPLNAVPCSSKGVGRAVHHCHRVSWLPRLPHGGGHEAQSDAYPAVATQIGPAAVDGHQCVHCRLPWR